MRGLFLFFNSCLSALHRQPLTQPRQISSRRSPGGSAGCAPRGMLLLALQLRSSPHLLFTLWDVSELNSLLLAPPGTGTRQILDPVSRAQPKLAHLEMAFRSGCRTNLLKSWTSPNSHLNLNEGALCQAAFKPRAQHPTHGKPSASQRGGRNQDLSQHPGAQDALLSFCLVDNDLVLPTAGHDPAAPASGSESSAPLGALATNPSHTTPSTLLHALLKRSDSPG